ncbi:MalY/PatB family protein [Streptomyces sp. NPDC054808]
MTELTEVPDAFDSISVEDLRRSGAMKWRKYPDALGAFVAEMDFGLAEPIRSAMTEHIGTGLTGYLPGWLSDDLRQATAQWHAQHYGWELDPTHVTPTADVIHAFEIAIEHFSAPGAPVLLMTPAYSPFFAVAAKMGRQVIQVPVHLGSTGWEVDLDALDSALAARGGLLLLCNPHNPIGKVYRRDELQRIAEIVDRHGGRVFSDEVHAPLVYAPAQHVPYASVSSQAAGHTITATSASKAFNIAGLKCAQIITSNPADRDRLAELGLIVTHGTSTLGVVANSAAYRSAGDWLTQVIGYLDRNRHKLAQLVAEQLPAAHMALPEATYFGWIDVRGLHLPADIGEFFLRQAKVALSDGSTFGDGAHGFVRLNFATPQPILTKIIEAMRRALPT